METPRGASWRVDLVPTNLVVTNLMVTNLVVTNLVLNLFHLEEIANFYRKSRFKVS